MKYALISVFDKTGIVDFARHISSLGYKIISTGGTSKVLSENNIVVVPIQEITKNPESFDGRMKTISFQIESGILFDRKNPSHIHQAKEMGIVPIDIVACNLYPFEKTISNPNTKLKEAVENIDVGGPTMIRAGGKNFENVITIVDPSDYQKVFAFLKRGKDNFDFRKKLAAKAFRHLSFYDSQIGKFLDSKNIFPDELTIAGRKIQGLRYGENPHQKAAYYSYPNSNSPLKNLKKLWGRDLSLVNITDINAGLESVRFFKEPAAVVIKHNTPCGIAIGETIEQALKRAIDADPESAFGGIIVLNKKMDLKCAKVITAFKDARKANIDIVAVPSIEKDALELLQKLRKSMGIYSFEKIQKVDPLNIKWLDQGFVVQTADNNLEESFKNWKIVTKKKPSEKQISQMKVSWKFISRIRSNAIIIVDQNLPMTRGIGTGQTSRVRSTKIALEQAGKYAKGAILASDSFFPFDDSVKLAKEHGVAAIIQQGGSVNDQLSIDAANKAGITMMFTGRRAFWH